MRRWLAYLQLVRLPNVFTAWADILFAALAAGYLTSGWHVSLLLLLASSCLYCSGMVWNDIFDIKQDERERPFRPLPSGKVPIGTAKLLAAGLMAAGIAFALAADMTGDGGFRGTLTAVPLAGLILAYDCILKRTWAGPIAMGGCRFLNVMLGFAPVAWALWQLPCAAVVGVYIAGVTWFARTEALESKRTELGAAFAAVISALLIAMAVPAVAPIERDIDTDLPFSSAVWIGQLAYPYLLIALLVYLGWPVWKAIERPIPALVQPAVKRMILGLVVLDAVLATAFVGPAGLALITLLLPASIMGRWVYST